MGRNLLTGNTVIYPLVVLLKFFSYPGKFYHEGLFLKFNTDNKRKPVIVLCRILFLLKGSIINNLEKERKYLI